MNQNFIYTLRWFIKFLVCLVQEKNMYIKCLLASLKTLTNYRNCFETHCYYGFLLVNFLKCTFMASLVVRASDCQCTSCNGPGFDPSIRRHSGI
jgi:hypothetical protein